MIQLESTVKFPVTAHGFPIKKATEKLGIKHTLLVRFRLTVRKSNNIY